MKVTSTPSPRSGLKPGPKPKPRHAKYMESAWFGDFKRSVESLGVEEVARVMGVSMSTIKNVFHAYSAYGKPGANVDGVAMLYAKVFYTDGKKPDMSMSEELRALRQLSMGDAIAFSLTHPEIRRKMDELLVLLNEELVEKRRIEVAALRASGAI